MISIPYPFRTRGMEYRATGIGKGRPPRRPFLKQSAHRNHTGGDFILPHRLLLKP